MTDSESEFPDVSNLDMTGRVELVEQTDWGGYSDVSRGFLHSRAGKIEVAIKALRIRHSKGSTASSMPIEERLRRRFYREVFLWRRLSHPNIVPLLGFTNHPDALPTLISPWYREGNVIQYLKVHPMVHRIPLIRDIARGLKYLHCGSIVHGDIKGENVLVHSSGKACLCDFGMSKFIDDAMRITGLTTTTPDAGGTTRFMCPELLQDKPKTYSTDIWAFGCLIMQIMTDKVPYPKITNNYGLVYAIMSGSPPMIIEERNKEFPDETSLWDYVGRCWSQNPEDRPHASEIFGYGTKQEQADQYQSDTDELGPPQPCASQIKKSQYWGDWITLPTFANVLFTMLQDSGANSKQLVYWTPEGSSFMIHPTLEFERDVLLRYFKHSSIPRFTAKLLRHGFQRLNNTQSMTDPKKMEFAHPSFLRDCPRLLNQISDCLGSPIDVVTPPSAGASEKAEVRQIQDDTSPLSSMIGVPTSSSAHSHSHNSRDGSESSSPPSRHLFPNFVYDLFEIVNNSVNSETIGWSEDGSAILLGNLFKFTQEVLPFYFGYSQISTFLRQLRIHNFRSLKGFRVSAPGQGIETWQFSHPCFRRGHPDLLVNIDASLMATTSDESDYSEVAFVHSSSEIEQLESIEQPSSTPKLLHQKNKQGSLGLHRARHGPSTTLLKESDSPSGLSESPLQSENFVTILHRLLQKNLACDQLKWCSNGKSFVIRLSSEFKNTILIPHFPGMDAVGFLRQLRALRFTILNQKTIQEAGNIARVATYTHAKFRHDQPELLSRVREKPAISVRSRTRPDTANTNTVAHGKVVNEKRSRRKKE